MESPVSVCCFDMGVYVGISLGVHVCGSVCMHVCVLRMCLFFKGDLVH